MSSDRIVPGGGGEGKGATPEGVGLSQVEPAGAVSPLRASIPSALVQFFVIDLQKGMDARRRAEPGSREVCDAWDNIAATMVSHMGSPEGPQFGDYVAAVLKDIAPGGEARRAETGTGLVEDENPIAEGEAPDLKSLQDQIQSLSTALAESERRAKDAEAALALAITRLNDISQGRTLKPQWHAFTGIIEIRRLIDAEYSTPTQETPNVEG